MPDLTSSFDFLRLSSRAIDRELLLLLSDSPLSALSVRALRESVDFVSLRLSTVLFEILSDVVLAGALTNVLPDLPPRDTVLPPERLIVPLPTPELTYEELLKPDVTSSCTVLVFTNLEPCPTLPIICLRPEAKCPSRSW